MSKALLFSFRPVTGSPTGVSVDPFWRDKTRCATNDVPQLVKLSETIVTPAQPAAPYRPYSKECPGDVPTPPPTATHCCAYTTTVTTWNKPMDKPVWNPIAQRWDTYEEMIRVTTHFDCPEGFTVPDIVQTFTPAAWHGSRLGVVDSGTRCFG